jgi:rfaE bifunctional protein nucleotidyltransferase chain/domain
MGRGMPTIKTIWVNGCFDVLHRGHIELFKYAKSVGDYLVVGIDCDSRVKSSKGNTRPINNQKDRKFVLESIRHIDKVVIFKNDDELASLISMHNVDLMIVGSDWKNKKIIGSQYAGSVDFFDRIGDYSTTKILDKS